MKKILLTSYFLLLTLYLSAQVDMGIPASTGMGGVANGVVKDWECIGINPANLGWKNNYRFSISTMIFGISAQSGAMDYSQLKNAILHPEDSFSTADKAMYAGLFSNTEGLNLQTNLNWMTFSFRVPKVGGFAMNLRDRTAAHIKLNKNAAEILFMGGNAPIFQDTMFWLNPDSISSVFNGSKIGFIHYRELNLAYGTKLFGLGGTPDSNNVSFYGGAGIKFLWGMGNYELVAEDGVFTGRSSFSSSYGVQYGSVKNFTPENTSGLFAGVGNGTAFDLGLGVAIKNIKITVSAVDMGKITWDKNVLIATDTILDTIYSAGLNSWNLAEQSDQMFSDTGFIQYKPGPAYETPLLSKFRVGLGWQLSPRMVAGADLVLPLSTKNPANLENAFVAVGTEIALANNFKFSFGFAGNSIYKFSLPFGVTLGRFFKICELRLATNDLLTYISPGENPNISLSFSLLRFNLADKK